MNMKLKLFAFAIGLATLSSCEKETLNSETTHSKEKTIDFEGLVAVIPAEFPDNVAVLSSYDLKKIGENSERKSRKSGEEKSFWEVFEIAKGKYPDVTNFEPKEYQKFFPKMTIDEIVKKQEEILSFIESLIGYETALLYSTVGSEENSNKTRISGYSADANSCEKWYFAGHARLDLSGLDEAKNLSFQYAGWGALDKSDANRHAVWNVFIGKYGARRYSTVSKAREVVEGLTDAHECHDPDGTDKSMDLHNNRVGLEYFSTIAERYKEGFLNYSVRVNNSDSDIFNYINALPTVQKTTVSEINSLNNTTLVKLQ